MKMYEYPEPRWTWWTASPTSSAIWLFPNLRLRNATDGLVRAQGRLSVRVHRIGDRLQGARRTTTGTPTRRTNVHYDTFADGVRLARRSSGGSTSAGCRPLAALHRHLARDGASASSRDEISPAKCASVDQLEQPPDLRARLEPELLDQLVAAHRRRRRPPARHASASRGELARKRRGGRRSPPRACVRRGWRAGRRPTAA